LKEELVAYFKSMGAVVRKINPIYDIGDFINKMAEYSIEKRKLKISEHKMKSYS